MPFATINGADLFYESHGTGPAIVFAHGRGGNHLSWWRQVAAFQGNTVVSPLTSGDGDFPKALPARPTRQR